jgi:hypothetical protein
LFQRRASRCGMRSRCAPHGIFAAGACKKCPFRGTA